MASKKHTNKSPQKMKLKSGSKSAKPKRAFKPNLKVSKQVKKTHAPKASTSTKIAAMTHKKIKNIQVKTSVKKADKPRKSKKNDVSLKILTPEMVESLKKDVVFTEYVNGKIGKRANEIILSLASPMTDEALAEKLEMKINDTRRVLNMLNTDGVARYIVNKNNKGWLTFKWYIDEENLKKMRGEIVIKAVTNNTILPDNCNDFYICTKCYDKAKLVYPFEVGYEMNFKCGECGSFFARKSKEDIESMLF